MTFHLIAESRLGLELRLDPHEAQAVDLTDGLGEQIIDLAVEEQLTAVIANQDPATGALWAFLSPATKRQKGHGIVGYRTGEMMRPSNWDPGDRDILPDSLRWFWLGPSYGIHFHNGVPLRQPPRPLVGWTPGARLFAEEAIAAALHALDE